MKRSWYCLLGKFAGKNLFIMGLGKEKIKKKGCREGQFYRNPTRGTAQHLHMNIGPLAGQGSPRVCHVRDWNEPQLVTKCGSSSSPEG